MMNRTIVAATLSVASLFAPLAAHADGMYDDRARDDDRGRAEMRHDGDRGDDCNVPQPAVAAPVVAQPVYAQPVYAAPAYAEPTYAEPTYAVPATTTVVAQPPVVVHHVDRDGRGAHDARRGVPIHRVQTNRARFEHGRR